MTEADWFSSTDPQDMLYFLRSGGKLSERKARLFAVAVCRRVCHLLSYEGSRMVVEAAEGSADGLATEAEMEALVAPGLPQVRGHRPLDARAGMLLAVTRGPADLAAGLATVIAA